MFGFRALGLKQAIKMRGIPIIKPTVKLPFYSFGSAVALNLAAQTGINPNTINLINLRELIMKIKS